MLSATVSQLFPARDNL